MDWKRITSAQFGYQDRSTHTQGGGLVRILTHASRRELLRFSNSRQTAESIFAELCHPRLPSVATDSMLPSLYKTEPLVLWNMVAKPSISGSLSLSLLPLRRYKSITRITSSRVHRIPCLLWLNAAAERRGVGFHYFGSVVHVIELRNRLIKKQFRNHPSEVGLKGLRRTLLFRLKPTNDLCCHSLGFINVH